MNNNKSYPNKFTANDILKLHDFKDDNTNLKRWIRISSSNEDLFYKRILDCINSIKMYYKLEEWIEVREFLSDKLNTNIDITTILWF